jgi:hypothetical protein
MLERRSFLAGVFAAAAAPAIVRSESLMKIFVPKKEVFVPLSWDATEFLKYCQDDLLYVEKNFSQIKKVFKNPVFQEFRIEKVKQWTQWASQDPEPTSSFLLIDHLDPKRNGFYNVKHIAGT